MTHKCHECHDVIREGEEWLTTVESELGLPERQYRHADCHKSFWHSISYVRDAVVLNPSQGAVE